MGARVALVIAREDPEKRLVRDAYARVPHRKAHPSLVRGLDGLSADEHESRLGELDRVVDEVEEHLPDAAAVSDEASAREAPHLGFETERLGRRAWLHEGRHAVDEDAHVERRVLELHLAVLELREVEDLVDDADQGICRFANRRDHLLLLAVELGVEQQGAQAEDPVHRCPYLMTHVGQELGLGLRCAFGGEPELLHANEGAAAGVTDANRDCGETDQVSAALHPVDSFDPK